VALTDRFGREHTYLRVSVTDRCNFRCVYCMPADGMDWMPKPDVLSYEEMVRLVRVFAGLGVTRVRLTGGEPLVRRDLELLVEELGQIPGLTDIAMTTNAHRLAGCADRLAKAGLSRLNVSLDSLKPERFKELTRGASLDKVLSGIDAALDAGIRPIKINVVVLEGETDDEVLDLIEYFSRRSDDFVLRFIEYMPFQARWHRSVPADDLRKLIRTAYTLEPVSERLGDGPAVYWRVVETGLPVGFISPLSEKFCGSCNRLRLMADGHLRTCLSDDGTPSLRDLLRSGASDQVLTDAIVEMVQGKREGHGAQIDGGVPFEGIMTRVGG
jgi:cyclic pyranopterin phosphate synthase